MRETDEVQSLRWPAYGWTGLAYVVKGACGNCGRAALVYVQHGHEAPWYHNGPECPCCGRIQWVGWHAPEQAPEKDMLAGLRAAAKIPHTPIDDDAPSEDAVEAMRQALLMELPEAARAEMLQGATVVLDEWLTDMARAALAAIGGREAALEAALRRCITVEHMDTHMPLAVRDAGKAALALQPSAAAEAVRELATKATADAAVMAEIAQWVESHEETCNMDPQFQRTICTAEGLWDNAKALRDAAQPFVGEGDA